MKTSMMLSLVLVTAMSGLVGCGKNSSRGSTSAVNYSTIGNLTGAAATDYAKVRDALNAKDPMEGLNANDQIRFINQGWTTAQKKLLFLKYTSITANTTCESTLIVAKAPAFSVQAASTSNACNTLVPANSWSAMGPYDRTQDAYLTDFVNLSPSTISSVARVTAVVNGQNLEAYKIIVTGFSTQTTYVVVPSLPLMANPAYKEILNTNGTPIYHQLSYYQGSF